MKASLRNAVLVLGVLGISACAGTREKSTYVPPSHTGDYSVDGRYVSNVENIARRQGIQVTWVNVPVKNLGKRQEQ